MRTIYQVDQLLMMDREQIERYVDSGAQCAQNFLDLWDIAKERDSISCKLERSNASWIRAKNEALGLNAKLAVVEEQVKALKAAGPGIPTFSLKAPEPKSAEWYRCQADTLNAWFDKALAERDAMEAERDRLAATLQERSDIFDKAADRYATTIDFLRDERDSHRERADRLAALVGTYREALEWYARSPNDNRTRAETVPMIDYTEDTAVARAALASSDSALGAARPTSGPGEAGGKGAT
jgi:hypothetical protein